ncbi:MAG TPA: biopolymer transporter ExbD, partial [Burkholderiales bacterium]|nr:biopolymer transporter ExbD [Burkholderiales bacterium]
MAVKRKLPINSDINVTPMADVMLVLLIIFMVVTPMLQKGVSVDLAKVVTAGLQEFRAHTESTELAGEQIEASKRALERAQAIVHAELK